MRALAHPAGRYLAKVLAIAAMDMRKLRHDPTELFTRAIQPLLWLLVQLRSASIRASSVRLVVSLVVLISSIRLLIVCLSMAQLFAWLLRAVKFTASRLPTLRRQSLWQLPT